MVVRSVVRRSRLKELGVGRATFRAAGEPVPVGATVQIPRNKNIAVSVTIENTGSRTVSGNFTVEVYYGADLADISDLWMESSEAYVSDSATLTLNPGDTYTFTGFDTVPASTWSEDTYVSVGVKLRRDTTLLDDLYLPDEIQIIAPTLRVEITDVTFSEA